MPETLVATYWDGAAYEYGDDPDPAIEEYLRFDSNPVLGILQPALTVFVCACQPASTNNDQGDLTRIELLLQSVREQLAVRMLADAGFGPVTVHDAPGDPGNAIFVTTRPVR